LHAIAATTAHDWVPRIEKAFCFIVSQQIQQKLKTLPQSGVFYCFLFTKTPKKHQKIPLSGWALEVVSTALRAWLCWLCLRGMLRG
jgi:hypothetical protein